MSVAGDGDDIIKKLVKFGLFNEFDEFILFILIKTMTQYPKVVVFDLDYTLWRMYK